MNIALFSDSYLPTKSGVVTVVIQLRKILEEMGHHVVIVTVSSNDKDYEEEPDPNIMRVMSILSPLGEGQYIGFPHRKAVAKFLQKNNIQIIHSHTEFFLGQMAVIVGKMLDIPVVATTHTMWEDYYRYYLFMGELIPRRLVRKMVKTMYKKVLCPYQCFKKSTRLFYITVLPAKNSFCNYSECNRYAEIYRFPCNRRRQGCPQKVTGHCRNRPCYYLRGACCRRKTCN